MHNLSSTSAMRLEGGAGGKIGKILGTLEMCHPRFQIRTQFQGKMFSDITQLISRK